MDREACKNIHIHVVDAIINQGTSIYKYFMYIVKCTLRVLQRSFNELYRT